MRTALGLRPEVEMYITGVYVFLNRQHLAVKEKMYNLPKLSYMILMLYTSG